MNKFKNQNWVQKADTDEDSLELMVLWSLVCPQRPHEYRFIEQLQNQTSREQLQTQISEWAPSPSATDLLKPRVYHTILPLHWAASERPRLVEMTTDWLKNKTEKPTNQTDNGYLPTKELTDHDNYLPTKEQTDHDNYHWTLIQGKSPRRNNNA